MPMRGTTLWWLDASKSAEATAEEEEARHRETDDHDPTRPFAFSENAEAGHRVWTNGLPETLRGAIYMTAVGANRPEIQEAVRSLPRRSNVESAVQTEIPMFGSHFPVHTSPLVATPSRAQDFVQVLRSVGSASPGLTFAPWIAPTVAVCLGSGLTTTQTLAVTLAMLRSQPSPALPTAKYDSWVATSVFELLLAQYDKNHVLRTAAFTASRYGELVYHTDGKVTLDLAAEPVEFGSRRHPLADVCFGWIECMEPKTLLWALDNLMIAGPGAIYDIGFAVLKTWSIENAAAKRVDLSIRDVVSQMDRPSRFIAAHHPIQPKAGRLAKLEEESIGRSRAALVFTGRNVAATELVSVSTGPTSDLTPEMAVGVSKEAAALIRTSCLLSARDASAIREVWNALPDRYSKKTPRKVFATNVDGRSLGHFYSVTEEVSPLLMLLTTTTGAVFGCFLPQAWGGRHEAGPHYYGGGETFVFSIRPHAQVYRWVGAGTEEEVDDAPSPGARLFANSISQLAHLSMSIGMAVLAAGETEGGQGRRGKKSSIRRHTSRRAEDADVVAARGVGIDSVTLKADSDAVTPDPANTYFMLGTPEKLVVGGGGQGPAIELDDELRAGFSAFSGTFHNAPLTPGGQFECVCMEAWALDGLGDVAHTIRETMVVKLDSGVLSARNRSTSVLTAAGLRRRSSTDSSGPVRNLTPHMFASPSDVFAPSPVSGPVPPASAAGAPLNRPNYDNSTAATGVGKSSSWSNLRPGVVRPPSARSARSMYSADSPVPPKPTGVVPVATASLEPPVDRSRLAMVGKVSPKIGVDGPMRQGSRPSSRRTSVV